MTEAEERERLRYLQLKAKAAGASVSPPSGRTEAPKPEGAGMALLRALGGVGSGPAAAGAVAQSLAALPATKAGARMYGQGATVGMADEAVGAVQALPAALRPLLGPVGAMGNALEALADLTSDVPAGQRAAAAEMPDLGQGGVQDRYRQGRDSERALVDKAKEEHPIPSFAGQALGALPLAIATGGAGVPTLARSVAQGVGLGAASGFGGSGADATQGGLGTALLDALKGGALGGVAGAAGYGLTKALAGAGSELLKRLGIEQGRKVLTGGTKSISQAKAVSDEAVERALQEGAIKPLGTTAGASERLGALREGAAKAYLEAVEVLEAAGVVGPQRDALARSLLDRAIREDANSVGSAVPGYMRRLAEDLFQKPATARIAGEAAQVPARAAQNVSGRLGGAAPALADDAGFRVGDMGELIATGPRAAPALPVRPSTPGPTGAASEVGEVIERPVERFGLTQAENIKRALQDQARKEYTKVAGNTDLGQAKMEAASAVRQAIEDAVEGQAAKAPGAAAAFQPAKQRLGNLIEADEAALKALNSAQNKNSISLRDMLAAGMAPGGALGKVATLPLSMLFRAFGPSTTAAGAYGLGTALPGLAPAALPGALTLEQAIMELLRQKEESPSVP